MRKITTLLAFLFFTGSLAAQSTARIQAIHNSPDPLADTVNVYVNGQPLLTDFAFRTASPFIDAPAGLPLRINILPKGVTDTSMAVFSTTATLSAGNSYHVIASGILDTANFSSKQFFELKLLSGAREMSSTAGQAEINVVHGSPDAGTVDVIENSVLNNTILDDFMYGAASGYTPLPIADYSLVVSNGSNTRRFGEFAAPLASLSLADSAMAVLASGFARPGVNAGPAFGLLAVLPSGNTILLPQSTAELQVVHNSGDILSAEYVDIWINEMKILDSVEFRTASPYLSVPAESDFDVSVMPIQSTDTISALAKTSLRLEADKSYIAIAAGLVSAAPFDSLKPLQLYYTESRRQAAVSGNTDVIVFHGSVDAPAVSVDELTVPVPNLISNLQFGDFTNYLELATSDYELKVNAANINVHVATYSAPLATLGLQDSSILVVASGFVDTLKFTVGDPDPLVVPKFGLYAVLASGGDFVALPVLSGIGIEEPKRATSDIYPVPVRGLLNLEFSELQNTEIAIFSVDGKEVLRENLGKKEAYQLNLTNLQKGVYLLKLKRDGELSSTQKIIVE